MIKLVTAAIVAGAFVVSGAAAGPLGGSMTASQSTADKTVTRESRGILAYFVDQLSVSVAMAARSVGFSAEEPDDHGTHYSNDDCDTAEPVDESEPEEAESKKFEQAGPEPIYFGF